MLHDPLRHEPLVERAFDEGEVRAAIARIVRDAEDAFAADASWPIHPLDAEGGSTDPAFDLYLGAPGVAWALHRLAEAGVATLRRSYVAYVDDWIVRNRAWLRASRYGPADDASYLSGETGLRLVAHRIEPSPATADRLEALIAGHLDHPARELMWGAPGTLLAALDLTRRTGESRWAELFRATAAQLEARLLWSPEHGCHYWTQDLYGTTSTYLDAVHGFVATAAVLAQGRDLLGRDAWARWQGRLVETLVRTAQVEGDHATWPVLLDPPPRVAGPPPKKLMQFCHGAPGIVVCAGLLPAPLPALDPLLVAGGEATWAAGPLAKGANLCHGTGGNGYAFLVLFQRTGDPRWLARARAFAMHGIAQVEAARKRYGQGRYSLWTGDPGFAVYLLDCLRGVPRFPSLQVEDLAPTPGPVETGRI